MIRSCEKVKVYKAVASGPAGPVLAGPLFKGRRRGNDR